MCRYLIQSSDAKDMKQRYMHISYYAVTLATIKVALHRSYSDRFNMKVPSCDHSIFSKYNLQLQANWRTQKKNVSPEIYRTSLSHIHNSDRCRIYLMQVYSKMFRVIESSIQIETETQANGNAPEKRVTTINHQLIKKSFDLVLFTIQ